MDIGIEMAFLHLEKFNGLEWMVDEVIESVNQKQDNLKSQST